MTEHDHSDEFYTGYLAEAPRGIAIHIRRAVLLLFLVVAGVAVLLARAQRPFDVAFFEFGNIRTFEGIIELNPHPMLLVDRPDAQEPSRYYLVAFGKQGADGQVQDLAGRRVSLEGTLIHRDDQVMIELVEGTVQGLDAAASPPTTPQSLGQLTLRGEIVDSKCYFGVMKPGRGKPHRACASLCIRGGIPPVFVVQENSGPSSHLLLVGSDGRAVNQEILEMVAEPLEITGEVVQMGDQWILKADPESYRRQSGAEVAENGL
jgi:hypothetical protein